MTKFAFVSITGSAPFLLSTKLRVAATAMGLLFSGCVIQTRGEARFVRMERHSRPQTTSAIAVSHQEPPPPVAVPPQEQAPLPPTQIRGNASWMRAPSMPVARSYLTAAAVDGRIFVFGGGTDEESRQGNIYQATARVDMFDATTQQWSSRTAAPTKRYSIGSTVANGMIYVVGGHSMNYEPGRLRTVEMYDPKMDRWHVIAPMADAHHEPAVASVNGRVYVFGGENGPQYVTSVEEFDPRANRWRPRSDMPHPRKGGSAAAFGGRVYLFGGIRSDGELISEVDIYDPENDRWTTAPNRMQRPRWMGTATTIGSLIVIAGGAGKGGTTYVREVDAFNPITGTWSTVAMLPSDRGNLAAALVGARLYLLGGCRSGCNEKIGDVDVMAFEPAI